MAQKLSEIICDLAVAERLNYTALRPYPSALAELLNERARVSRRYTDKYQVDASHVEQALVRTPIYGRTYTTMGILPRRILQALSEVTQGEVTAKEFWGEDRLQKPTNDLFQQLGRQAYDQFLPVLDRPNNRHFQTSGQLQGAANTVILVLFENMQRAYEKSGLVDLERLVPTITLERLAKALECEPTEIISADLWRSATIAHMERAEASRKWYREWRAQPK